MAIRGRNEPTRHVDTAAWLNNVGLLRNLLAEGANPNEKASPPHFYSALQGAIHHRSIEMVRCLLDHGADPNHESADGGTPILSAARSNRVDIMEALVRAGARVDATSWKYDTVDSLMIAARRGAMDGVKFLLKHGCRINRQSRWGVTALHFAMLSKDQPKLVKEMLRLGADPWLKSRRGRTALDYAERFGRYRAAAILRRAMAKSKAKARKKRMRRMTPK